MNLLFPPPKELSCRFRGAFRRVLAACLPLLLATWNCAAAVEVIVDNPAPGAPTVVGVWGTSSFVPGFYGSNYLTADKDVLTKSVRYIPTIPTTGSYEVFTRWTEGSNRARAVPIDIHAANGTHEVEVDQRTGGNQWVSLGTYPFNAGTTGSVVIANAGADGFVIADAVKFVSTAAVAPPPTPLGVAMTANSPSSITLSWYTNPTATGYRVFTSTSANGPFTLLSTVTQRTATHSGVPAGQTRYYKVSATNSGGESAQSATATGFTIAAWTPASFPVNIAKNMCISLNAPVVCFPAPLTGNLSAFTDGVESTACRVRRNSEIKIKLNTTPSFSDAAYLMLNYRTDFGPAEWSNDPNWRTLRTFQVIESHNSTTGNDGTWTVIGTFNNTLLDAVVVVPNNNPKWIGVRSSGGETIPLDDRRLNSGDLRLCRLDVFRAAPAGFRNDYWIFAGDSLIVGDMPGGPITGRTVWFSDLVRVQHPDRYPMVVHAAQGGEVIANTLSRIKRDITQLSPTNPAGTPTATLMCFETGFNDVGSNASLASGPRFITGYQEVKTYCESKGMIYVPVRIQFATAGLNINTLEPTTYNIFHNTLAVNLAGVDIFARTQTPYAVDPVTRVPYADYWTYTRTNYATAFSDGVHHTPAGADGINRLWADVAHKMIYSQQP